MSSSAEIKEQLLFVSNKIDEAIQQIHEYKTQEIHIKQQEEILNDNSPNFIGRITSLKSQVESIQKNLEEVYNIDKVNQLESDIKKKEKMLRELKGERFILNNVVKEQNKGINEYLSKFDSTKEQKELSELIKKVKEENHNIKEIYKEMTNKMKEQKTKIDALEKRCKIIKQNIEFQKKKQMKEVQKTSKDEKSDDEEDDYGSDVEKMKEVEKNIINEINIEEKNYRTEINEQNDVIKKLKADITKINFKIKNLVQEKKMDEIKRKNKMRGKSSTKIHSNQNEAKNTQTRDNKRHLSNYKPRPNQNNANLLKNNKISNTEKRAMLRTPNFVGKDGERFTKPFEIKKFNDLSNKNNDEKNYTTTTFNDNKKMKLTAFNDNVAISGINEKNVKSNKGAIALKEIMNLKNEIQNALKNNIVVLDEDLQTNTNYTGLYKNNNENNNNNINVAARKTADFGAQLNYKEKEEVGKNVGYNMGNGNNYKKTVLLQSEKRIKDYQINPNDKISEENSKRKPFDKFNFK